MKLNKKLFAVFSVMMLFASLLAMPTFAADAYHQTLASNDGWAAYSGGTVGGSSADSAHTYTVTTRKQFVDALASGTTPKILIVSGTLNFNVDDNNNVLGLNNYKDSVYNFNTYLADYDPSVWGTSSVPSGTQEDARKRSENNQKARIFVNIPSNTTIIGSTGAAAKIVGGNLNLSGVDNVIIRNIEFQDAYDYFPQWDPTDGDSGNWNSMFDNITAKGSTHIWVDHCSFDDGAHPDSQNGTYYGREYQHHDGTFDISNASDLVTVSYNYFHDHDKLGLVGSSDSATGDSGHLRITFHHNYYQNVVQRAPRVRYGEVHIYNNYYQGSTSASPYPYNYSWGIGYASKIYAQNNYFSVSGASASGLATIFKGTALYDSGTVLNGSSIDVSGSLGLSSSVGWTPTLYDTINATGDVPGIVTAGAGAGKLGSSGGSSYVKFKNHATGLYIDGMGRTANGSNAGQWSGGTSYNQQWELESAGTYVKIKNRATGLYLDGMGRSSNGSAAGQWSDTTSYNKQWLEETAGSYVKFKNRATGLYLDGMGSTSNGSDLGQWGSSTSYNQQFQIVTP